MRKCATSDRGRLFRAITIVPVVLAGALVLAAGASLLAQRPAQGPTTAPTPVHHVGGERDGISVFPLSNYPQLKPLNPGQVDFKHYHAYEEINGFLKAWAEKYPNLVDLYSVGKSFEGRDIWQVTITNKKTGKDTDKPAMFIEGGRHAGEISGCEATFMFIHHLLTNYGTDPIVTRLVDTKAFYAKPNNDPDGNTLYHLTAQSLRSTVRPFDSDGDGQLDEDSGEDLDNDGFLRQMRKMVGAGKGSYIKDPKDAKGRAMKRVRAGEGDYEIYSEGIDNDGDGRYNEDGIGGLDLHRNYPENWRPMTEATGRGWTQGGAGAYPLSETETRAVFQWVITHPNISINQSLDTVIPMLLRGPSTSKEEESMFPEDAAYYQKFDKEGLKITGYPWAGDVYYTYATRGGPDPVTGEPPLVTPLFGHGPDFGYLYLGSIWYGNEMWNGGRFMDYDKDGRWDEWEVLRWNDENRAGKGDFLDWTPYKHPQLGDVEIGGWNPKFYGQNAPPDLMEEWVRKELNFALYLAQQLPQVKLTDVTVTPAKGPAGEAVFDVKATVTNQGLMPTALKMAERVKMVKPDTFTIALAKGQELVAAPAGKPTQRASIEIGLLKPGETRSVTWQVKGAGAATVTIGSTRGGVDKREVTIGQ